MGMPFSNAAMIQYMPQQVGYFTALLAFCDALVVPCVEFIPMLLVCFHISRRVLHNRLAAARTPACTAGCF
jgi:hypothetical protein